MIDRENFEDNKEEELKRADHQLYVTLKYTRTCDVMKNIIKRLISAFDFAVSEALSRYKIKISVIAQLRFKQLEKKMPEVKKYHEFYLLLKKIDKSKYTAREEFRKHVTLVLPDLEVDVEKLKEYFERTKEFVKLVS